MGASRVSEKRWVRIDIRHPHDWVDAFTTGVSEKSQGEYKGQGQAKAEYQGVKYL